MGGVTAGVRRLLERGGGNRRRIPGLRTAKLTLAAVLAYVVAGWLGTSSQPVLASLTALLVLQVTTFASVAQGYERVASVVAGVLVAVGVASVTGLTWLSLGLVVAASLVVGRLLRLGDQLLEVPISGMLVLAVHGSEIVAVPRVTETLVGAAVGIGVNLLVAPPLHVLSAGAAIRELTDELARCLDGLGDDLRDGWSREVADTWLEEARAVRLDVSRADRTLARAEEGARLNPRGPRTWEQQERQRTALTALEHCYVTLRNICRALLDRTYFVPVGEPDSAYSVPARRALADVVESAARAARTVGSVTTAPVPAPVLRGELDGHLADLHARRDVLADLLSTDPTADPAAWQQHGALLAAVDRMRVELAAAAEGPGHAARPARLGDRQRGAVRTATAAAVTPLRRARRRARPAEGAEGAEEAAG